MEDIEKIVCFRDEVLLLRWSDNSRDGMTVTFQIPGEYAEHPFKSSPTGKKTGKRYAAVLVEIGDDEKPVVQEEKSRVGPLCLEAVGLCRREDFQRFASRATHGGWDYQKSEGGAAEYIKDFCGVKSRKCLDEVKEGAARFSQLKREFLEWQR